MKERNWSYLAGIFDGEGCAHIARVNYHGKGTAHSEFGYRVDVHITTTSRELAEWLVKHFGGVFYAKPSPEDKPWKDAYRWVPKGKKNKEELFLGILPYLVIKRSITLICLEFLRLTGCCPEKRSALCDKARELTRRGKPVETNMLDPVTPEKIESELIGDYESAPVVTLTA